jgi:GMP reductase
MREQLLQYKDVCLIPDYSKLRSRSEADVSVDFLGRKFKLPIIPSNMKCVIDMKLAKWLSNNGYFYVMHRFGVSNLELLKIMYDNGWTLKSISVGVGDDSLNDVSEMAETGYIPDFITIDIAHGDSIMMKEMIQFIKALGIKSKIIAGNVATTHGYLNLAEWGADAVKIGIGSGKICSTKNKTGFTYPMYSCIEHIYYDITHQQYRTENNDLIPIVPIIADGGIREHGDITKAISAGADMVMAGGVFSKLIDSPAEIIDGHKIYYGSASQYNKGEYKHVEGIKKVIEMEPMTYEQKLIEIQQDLQSAVSYSGGDKLTDIRKCRIGMASSWET